MILVACISFYQDVRSLKRCLDSLQGGPNFIICVDGKYKLFEAENQLSNDGSRELVSQYDNCILIDAPNLSEYEKRNKYLKYCKAHKIEYALMIDSDEWVWKVDWKEFKQNIKAKVKPDKNHYNIRMIYNPETLTTGWYPRLWYQPGDMEYYLAHCIFRNKPKNIIFPSLSDNPQIEGIILNQDDALRESRYLEKTDDYQVKLVASESEIRKKYGI